MTDTSSLVDNTDQIAEDLKKLASYAKEDVKYTVQQIGQEFTSLIVAREEVKPVDVLQQRGSPPEKGGKGPCHFKDCTPNRSIDKIRERDIVEREIVDRALGTTLEAARKAGDAPNKGWRKVRDLPKGGGKVKDLPKGGWRREVADQPNKTWRKVGDLPNKGW